MKKEPLFKLWEEDEKLFTQMNGHYQTEEERMFFETMRYKEMYEPSYSNDDLILEDENEDNIFIVRRSANEYEFGCYNSTTNTRKYLQCLANMLKTKLSDIGIISENGTMLDWLRARNYKGIRYDRNFDLM